jgi:outer membrane protein, heavy metal efflux system
VKAEPAVRSFADERSNPPLIANRERFRRRARSLLLCAVLTPLAGWACASVDPRPSFHAVAETVRARADVEPSWPRTADEEASAEQAARALLAAPLTPESAARVALLRNRALLAEVEELGVAQADYAQATRIANPRLAGFRRTPSAGPGVNTEVELAEDVLDVLVQPIRKRLAAVELEAAKLRLGQTMLDLVAETKEGFFELVAAAQTADRLRLVRDLAAAAADLARRQRAAGNLGELDVAQQEAMALEAAIAVTRAELDEGAARERLAVLFGLAESAAAWTVDRRLPELPATEPEAAGLEDRALRERLDLQAARFGVDLIGRALSLKKKTRFFPAGIEVGINREQETDGVRLRGPQIAIQLPIFDTGAASIARLEAERRRSQRQLEQLATETRAEVRLGRAQTLAAREVAVAYRDQLLPRRVLIVDQTLRHYNMMLKGVYDLLLARRDEVEAEKGYIAALRDYWIARVRLERAVGGPLEAAPAALAPAGELASPSPAAAPTHESTAPGGSP